MSIVTKNEYTVRFVNEVQKSAIADSMAKLCAAYETPDNPIAQITRVRPGVESIVEDDAVMVNFIVTVTPQAAADAGSVGTPEAFAVEAGTKVIFQAVPATGYNFVGWYLNSVKVSSDLIAELAVNAPAIAGQTVNYVATFVAA